MRKEEHFENTGAQVAPGEKYEAQGVFSVHHNITIDVSGEEIVVRQINNPVFLNETQKNNVIELSRSITTREFNISPPNFPSFLEGNLEASKVVSDPVTVILISSKGLLNDARWTSNQPSEGIWVLAEWLSRNTPSAAPVCIDPNLISPARFEEVLLDYSGRGTKVVFGFSPLPVNLRNDAQLICEVKEMVPNSFVVVGGIGSESLNLLPTNSGKRGITNALPVDLVIPGPAVLELTALTEKIHLGEIKDVNDLLLQYQKIIKTLHEGNTDYLNLIEEIQKAREIARQIFIPDVNPDLIHKTTYLQANSAALKGRPAEVVSVLIDNRCDQGCYFCASPKTQVISSMEEAVKHIKDKSTNAKVIAFNDNDLSNNPNQTILLCKLMKEHGINQPKHGKMRADRYLPDLITTLADVGFVRLAVGVESFARDVRNSLGKANFTPFAVEKTLEHMLKVGIRPEINLILFTPHETLESLEETTTKALEWVGMGATLYVTFGLFATPNSPGVMKLLDQGRLSEKIDFLEINHPQMKSSLVYPTQWKARPEVLSVREVVFKKRQEILNTISNFYKVEMSVPIEAYIAMALLGNHFKLDGYEDEDKLMSKIYNYIGSEIHKQYISI